MSTTKDGPGKDAGKPAEPPKRPHATIDLKATEVEVRELRPEAGSKPAPSGKPGEAAAAASQAASAVSAAAATAGADTGKSAQRPGEKAASAAAQASVPPVGATARGAAGKSPPIEKDVAAAVTAAPTASRPAGSGIGRFLSLLAAAVIGGFAAIWGAETLGPQLRQTGLLPPASGGASPALETRIAEIEAQMRRGGAEAGSAGLAQRLEAAERRLAGLDEVQKAIAALRQGQAESSEQTKALVERIVRVDGSGEPGERLARLEDTLKTLAAAAGTATNGQAGRLPQLAAITGKLTDLEAALASQTAALRKGLLQELEARLAQTAEAGETAKSGTLRLDRDVAALKTENARLAQRVETARADADRVTTTLRTLQEEAGSLRSALEALKGDLASELRAVAKPSDVSKAVEPVASRIASLESSVQGVVRSEEDRRQNVSRIVLALELGNLKRVVDSGQRYAAELSELEKASGPRPELAALARFKDQGVPTLADLTREFRPIANAMLDAETEPVEGSVVDRLLAGAKSIVRVRKTGHAADDKSSEAIAARMETALKAGRLADVVGEAKGLPERAASAIKPWLGKVEARHAVETAIATIEGQLKASLSGAGKASN